MKDRARIHVEAGGGGDGCMSFRREAHVPKGGPDGGDGGQGGDVVLVCDDSYRDLEHFRRQAHFKAKRGVHGQGSQRHGADGETLEIPVPPGTEVLIEADGTQHDLTRAGQRAVVARGGSGGRGNRHFSSSTRQSPRFAERGLAGDESWLTLQLKLLADVGLIGLPNAGKSSLISRLTRATPKIADYPFTTLVPALGTLHHDDRQLVIADIPGLIEGAADGVGLGHDFLAHVERTRMLVHVLDLAPLDGSDPVANFDTVERELALYQKRLATLPRILALSKADLVTLEEGERARAEWQQRIGEAVPVILTSSATRQGLDELSTELLRRVPVLTAFGTGAGQRASTRGEADDDLSGQRVDGGERTPLHDLPEHRVFRPAPSRGFRIARNDEGAYVVEGESIDKLVARYDLENEDALMHLERRLRGLGVIRALEAAGFEPGDDVEIAGTVFELDP
ncbi:MAG TPA: GTPase ObgE [Solirubrobacteraceae bacterium]|jgi:GTP-binding protein|nr:GTPase ObgE [Solirubrobacteraceae bacterium]